MEVKETWIDFRDVDMPSIDWSPALPEELEIVAKNLATVIWRDSPTPDIQAIGTELFKENKAKVTLQQLAVIKGMVKENKLWLTAIAVRYVEAYLENI